MSSEGLLPEIFGQVHPEKRVPVKGALICFALLSLPIFMMDIEVLLQLVSLNCLMINSLTNLCGITLRYRSSQKSNAEYWLLVYILTALASAISMT